MRKKITRRRFLKEGARLGMAAGAVVGAASSLSPLAGCASRSVDGAAAGGEGACPGPSGKAATGGGAPKVLLISIDSLDPRILDLDSRGVPGGKDGDWLMPRVRAFLDQSTWFVHSRCHLPSATDMNHLNAVAGTCSAQTGIFGVSLQFFDWNPDGTGHIVHTSLDYARDDKGRPVDTLFSAWKRRWPESTTLFASGKGWVADMFRTPTSGVDLFLKGDEHPCYVPSPERWSFYDPPGDPDAGTDAESFYQRLFCDRAYGTRPTHFPPDQWIALSSLEMLRRESPDLALILLAEMDDAQHGLGTVTEPERYGESRRLFSGPVWVHGGNGSVYREPVVDAMQDVDRAFGSLIEGIRALPDYRDATIVFYSDHGHLTHRETVCSNFDSRAETDAMAVLYRAGVITRSERNRKGVCAVGASSVGAIYIQAGTLEERRRRGEECKAALLAHRVWNESSGEDECPWHVLGEPEVLGGIAGVCEPGELFHPYFAPNNEPGMLHSPDLALLMKSGWQLPISKGLAVNLGSELPWYVPDDINVFLGGHGSNDTVGIVMAMNGPDIPKGRIVADQGFERNYRISDIGVTLARRLGLELRGTTIGKDRSEDLA